MEEVEGLNVETVYNLIKNGTLSLDEFEDWLYHRDVGNYNDGYLAGYG